MKIHRMISILLEIESKGKVTARDLARQFKTSTRTIYRDIDNLCEAGIPMISETGPGGGISLKEGYHTDIDRFGKNDNIYLYLKGIGIDAKRDGKMSLKPIISVEKTETEDGEESYPVTLRIPNNEVELLSDCEVYDAKKRNQYFEATVNMYTYGRATSEFWTILFHSYIVEPMELRENVKGMLRGALERYENAI